MSEEEYEYVDDDSSEEYEYDEEDYEEEKEYTGLMALLHDEKMEPHVHLGILLSVTFIVAIVVYVTGP